MDMKSKRAVAAIAAAVLAMALFALAGCSGSAQTTVVANVEHSITTTASAEVKVVPDKASIGVGVTSREDTATAVQATNSEAVDAVVNALIAQGIPEKDIQTTSVNMYPSYDYSSNTPVLLGYEMTTSLTITGIDIDSVGSVLEAAVAAGATRSDGIRYYASNYDEAYAKALNDAIEASRAKAESMAKAGGVKLGGVIGIVEGYQDTSARFTYGAAGYGYAEDAMASNSYKAMPGELSIEARATVTYVIE